MRSADSIARSKALEIKVHAQGRSFVSEDKPFFWQADTAWEIFHRLDIHEARHYLDTRAAQGFNVIFGVVFAEHGGFTLPNRAGEWPFERLAGSPEDMFVPDVFKPNPKYYDFVDEVIDYAASVGIRVALQPVWGNYVVGMYHSFTPAQRVFNNVDAARAYAAFLGERYPYMPWLNGGDLTPFWFDDAIVRLRSGKSLGGPEVVVEDFRPIYHAFAEGITAGEAKHRADGSKPLITFHPSACWLPEHPKAIASNWFPNAEWLSFDAIQSGHAAIIDPVRQGHMCAGIWTGQNSVDAVREMYEAATADGSLRPVVDLEPHYESTHHDFKPNAPLWTAAHIRQGAWQAVFAGVAGVAYGVNSVWQMNNKNSKTHPPIQHATQAEHNWFDELHLPGAAYVGIIHRFIASRPRFDSRIPDQTIITSDTHDRPTPAHDVDGKDAQLIAGMRDSGGGWLAVYSPQGAAFDVDLSKLSTGQVAAVWFDPRTGETQAAGMAVAAGKASMVPPTNGQGQDWILLVETVEV